MPEILIFVLLKINPESGEITQRVQAMPAAECTTRLAEITASKPADIVAWCARPGGDAIKIVPNRAGV
jgi:hypothetical protein